MAVAGTGYVAVTCGDRFSCGLHGDDSVACWGANGEGQLGNGMTADSADPVLVVDVADATGIAGGALSGYAVRAAGTVSAWGYNAYRQLGDGTKDNARVRPVRSRD